MSNTTPATSHADPPTPSDRSGRRFSRAALLRGAAGTTVGLGLTGSSLIRGTPTASAAPTVHKIKDLTGPGLTSAYQMEATDLGIPTRMPDGRMIFIFGDSFARTVGDPDWRSPTALFSATTDLAAGVTWSGAFGGDRAEQLWAYQHDNPEFSTVLPSDVITIGGSLYLHVMVNKGLGNVVWTEIWRSDDNGGSWVHTGAKFDAGRDNGLFQLITWGLGDDGFVYVYSTGFQRDKPIILHRVPADRIAQPDAYEPWGYAGGTWGWGNAPTPVLEGKAGEMCLRPMGGKWILTWFDAGNYRIDSMIMDTPTSNLYEADRQTLIHGGSWGQEDDTHVAQLYGGYIIPGSTLNDLHLSVSQWNTTEGAGNWPYHVMQFRVQGLG
ncbi:DUF4185 domain-containing protein [Microlunatus soli]|uniref:DUF4185 domain-containing protein n=1 Tax=Microlunatus soli TaxID=630515 RepID=A0A1H1Y2X4_9ACTN|nr:DUF4185 domain-containing protein [Microlunatus soli]SDT15752.1 protein of unknown function [Microlunatus soli]